MDSKLYYDLLEIIETQDKIICFLNRIIADLVNSSLEKENMIHELMN